ncbi:MAG: hypothetical protein JO331_15305 [Verrucomicrobia bacterium]|nr:hypothetical protein [Verrucomicrobiota bacterium]
MIALSQTPFESLPPSQLGRPGQVARIKGIIFQSDYVSVLGAWLIRPIETLDRRLAGLARGFGGPPIAMHAGIHVVLQDGREFVAEKLCASIRNNFIDGLNWTPIQTFRARNHGGWDLTVPPEAFRKIDTEVVAEATNYLNQGQGHPFLGEDCTVFVERAFGKRRLFADSPTARLIGLGLRVGDPALPLIRPDAQLSERATRLLRLDVIKALPDPIAPHHAPNARIWLRRGVWLAGLTAGTIWLLRRARMWSAGSLACSR